MKEMVLPQFGMGMSDGTIIAWHKAEGERVEEGEALCEVEAAKTNVEVEAPCSGILQRILVPAGANVPVNTIIAVIGDKPLASEPEAPIAAEVAHPAAPVPEPVTATPDVVGTPVPPPVAPAVGRIAAPQSQPDVQIEPRARRAARMHGVDLLRVTGSGPGGRIIESDVLAAVQTRIAQPQPVSVAPLPPVARAPVGTALRQLQMTCDARPLQVLLQQLSECERAEIPIEAALVRSTAVALARSAMTHAGIGLRSASGGVVMIENPTRFSLLALARQLDEPETVDCPEAAMIVEWHSEGWLDGVAGLGPGASTCISFNRRSHREQPEGDQFTIVLTLSGVHPGLADAKSFLGILRGLLSHPLAMLA